MPFSLAYGQKSGQPQEEEEEEERGEEQALPLRDLTPDNPAQDEIADGVNKHISNASFLIQQFKQKARAQAELDYNEYGSFDYVPVYRQMLSLLGNDEEASFLIVSERYYV